MKYKNQPTPGISPAAYRAIALALGLMALIFACTSCVSKHYDLTRDSAASVGASEGTGN